MLVISAGTRNHFALDLDRSVLGVIDSDEPQIPVRIERKRVVDGLISEYRRAA
jgi:hypothetical protein